MVNGGVGTLSDVSYREFDGRAAVTYPAPHGTESFVLLDDTAVEFGRGAQCPLRFAYAPVADEGVPRVAGRFVVGGGRVFVEAVDAPGRSALQLTIEGRPQVLVASGDAFSPREPSFTIGVRGTTETWHLNVDYVCA